VVILLQEYDITIIGKLGKDNVVVDFLSRLTNECDIVLVEDNFPDENIFSLSTHTPWYADISHYLVAGEHPSHLSTQE
jgi:hypothetical protein